MHSKCINFELELAIKNIMEDIKARTREFLPPEIFNVWELFGTEQQVKYF